MPWPPKQRVAIFLDVKRRKGEAAAEALMHEAGYGGGKARHKRRKRRAARRARRRAR
jgi:hypothetical protein